MGAMANLISMAVLEEIQIATEPLWQEAEGRDYRLDRRVSVPTSIGRIDVRLRDTDHGPVTDIPFTTGAWHVAWYSYYREGWSEPDAREVYLRLPR